MSRLSIAVYLLFLSGLVSIPTLAMEKWIFVAGHFDKKSDRPDAVYEQAYYFAQACRLRGLKPKAECIVFSDFLGKLSSDLTVKPYVVGAGQKKDILKTIERSVLTAKENDKIVLAFASHGGVLNKEGEAKSCIVLYRGKRKSKWINEILCEDELKHIFATRSEQAQKARTFLVVSSCMSGGFHSIGDRNVCTYTAGQKFRTTFPVNEWNLWRYAAKHKGTNLFELGAVTRQLNSNFYQDLEYVPMFGNSGFRSNAIQISRCLNEPVPSHGQKSVGNITQWKTAAIKKLLPDDFETFRQVFFLNLDPQKGIFSELLAQKDQPWKLSDIVKWQERILEFLEAHRVLVLDLCKSKVHSTDPLLCAQLPKLRDMQTAIESKLNEIKALQVESNSMVDLLLRDLEKLNSSATLIVGAIQGEVSNKTCLMDLEKEIDEGDAELLREAGVSEEPNYLDSSDKSLKESRACESDFVL